MLNNIKTIEKIMKEENRKVIKTENPSKIKKQGKEKEGASNAFKENLIKAKKERAKKKHSNIKPEKIEMIEEDVVIAPSLEKLIEEHKSIEEIVIKRFSKYPELREKIKKR